MAEPPRADEPVHPEHVPRALQLQLESEGIDAGSVRWAVHPPGTDRSILTSEGTRWDLRIDPYGATPPDVTTTATRSALARCLTAPPPQDAHPDDVQITGEPAAIRAFLRAIEIFPAVPANAQARRRSMPTGAGSEGRPYSAPASRVCRATARTRPSDPHIVASSTANPSLASGERHER